ncbi:MAG: amino acid permease [Planctomycetota bacterium]|nr:MAG: amino acid permease [Planctomycetota bacterium]
MAAPRFGTFGGVFTPCTLTILGVIMFLRFGTVVGEAGVVYSVAIVAAANAITLLTSLSLSAIATNTRVRGGGAYFLISRSLGVEFGGAIGVVFFLAQSISVAMYVIGFSEAYRDALPSGGLTLAALASIVNAGVFVCVFIGAGWTIKVQYLILALLAASLLSFYVGAADSFDSTLLQQNVDPHFSPGTSLFTMFALFFPAVTGIMAGANMSGDLKNPGRSIPLGTLSAVAVTAAVYLSLVLMLGAARPASVLVGESLVMGTIARWPVLITAGVFAATLSSALGSMMGAPRILQAFARDNVLEWLRFVGVGSGPANEPRRAIVVTFAISQVCILLGDLDAIAPVVTMAFLITYGLLNLATFYEAITKNPSYRPRFRWCHWSMSLAGAVGCLAVMVLIDWRWASAAILLVAMLHRYISLKEIQSRWGDVHSGVLFERARRNLLALEEELYHPKNWRPIVLALSGTGWSRPHLAVYGHWLTTGRGILTLGQIITGEVDNRLERRRNQEQLLHRFIREEELEAFPAVVVARHVSDGIEALVQSHGLGALRPNTILVGWPNAPNRGEAFGAMLRSVAGLERSIVTVRFRPEPDDAWQAPPGTIDVWWRGHQNGDLMLLLAYLLTQNSGWRGRTIRVLRVIANEAGYDEVHQHLTNLIETARIRAIPQVVIAPDAQQAIQATSASSAVVFLGFEAPAEGLEQAFFDRMEAIAGALPRTVFVSSSGGMTLDM